VATSQGLKAAYIACPRLYDNRQRYRLREAPKGVKGRLCQ